MVNIDECHDVARKFEARALDKSSSADHICPHCARHQEREGGVVIRWRAGVYVCGEHFDGDAALDGPVLRVLIPQRAPALRKFVDNLIAA